MAAAVALNPTALLLAGVLCLPTAASAQTCGPAGVHMQVLGSGGPRINPERASASSHVWVDGLARVLVDAGGGAFLRFGQSALLWLSDLERQARLPISGPTAGKATPDVAVFLRRLFDSTAGAYPLLGATVGGDGRGVPLEVRPVDAANPASAEVFEAEGITVTSASSTSSPP